MKQLIFTSVTMCLLMLNSLTTYAQKKILIEEKEQVETVAKAELDSLMKPGTEFLKKAAEQNLKGEYIIDLTIFDKGKIQSIYMVSSDADDFKMQNRVKDFIRTIEFGFKMPKNKSYKFQYTFQFN